MSAVEVAQPEIHDARGRGRSHAREPAGAVVNDSQLSAGQVHAEIQVGDGDRQPGSQ